MNWKDDDLSFTNEGGSTALTREYLLSRGYCCGNGCMNCPYDYKNVSEPKKTQLLNERKKREEKQG